MPSARDSAKSSSRTRQSPDVSVVKQLEAIDTSPLEELIDTRAQQVRLKEYLERANERREHVSDAVWKRVVLDYERRSKALTEAASPLEGQVRAEYAKLHALLGTIERDSRNAQFQKEEAEFRHEIGELTDEELAARIAEPEQQLAQCATDLEAVERLKARFLEAFESEEDLLAGQPAPPPKPADSSTGAEPADHDAADESDAAEPSELDKTRPPSATRVLSPEELVPGAPEPPQPEADEDEARTFLLPAAALLITGDDPESTTEYRLASLNYIGRAEDNQLRVAQPGISRKHALVSATKKGYMVQDLDSQNGTYVNGTRITEQALADGDEVVIGDVHMVFRLPWPAADAPAKRKG